MNAAVLELGLEATQFAALLRQLREARGLTQEALAHAAGLHQKAISHLEQGINLPTMTTAFALADAMGIDINEFRKAEDFPTRKIKPRGRGRPAKAKADDDDGVK